jgi:hypothetical protein
MTCYVREVQYVYYIEEGSHITEILVEKFVPGIGMKQHREWIYDTAPTGDWIHMTFEPNQTRYDCFLDCMVKKTVEVRRRLCRLALTNHDTEPRTFKAKIRLMNAIRILDPTFVPPRINRKCGWQNELLTEIYGRTSIRVIAACTNSYRLAHYFTFVRTIGL